MPLPTAASLDLLAILSVLSVLALLSALWCGGAMSLGGLVGADWLAGSAAGMGLWAWLILQAVRNARVTQAAVQRPMACPPDPATILRDFPPRVDDTAAVRAETAGVAGSKLHQGANDAVITLLRDQIERGRELGIQVFAYHRGR